MPRYLSCFSLLLFLLQKLKAGKSVEIFMFGTTDILCTIVSLSTLYSDCRYYPFF